MISDHNRSAGHFISSGRRIGQERRWAGICQPLEGCYSINPAASGNRNFTSFKAALAKLKACGVSGPVTVEAAAGTYQEQGFSFPVVPGASAISRVTVRPAPGASVKLQGSTGKYIVQIAGKASFYTIEGFELDGSVKANAFTQYYCGPILFSGTGGQQHITLRRLYIHDFGAVDLLGPTFSGTNNRFVHNTVLVTSGSGYGVGGNSSGNKLIVQNNVFLGPQGSTPTFIKASSAAAPGSSCLFNAKAGYTTGPGDVLADPKLVQATGPAYDLHLQAGSPCINKALLGTGVTDDFDGDPRGSQPDIGADERVTGP